MKLLAVVLFMPGFAAFAQPLSQKPDKALGVEFFKGFILEHKPQISHLITDHPTGFRLVYNRKTHGDCPWESYYNFPDRGFTFVYMDYHDDRLGKTLALIPHLALYLRRKREAKSQVLFKAGFGVGYTTEKFDPVTNNQNNVISTDITGAVLLQLGYDYKVLPRFHINSSLAMTHFSNGALKKPNSGVNIMTANIGIYYTVDDQKRTYTYREKPVLSSKPTGYSLMLMGGAHEAVKIGAGAKPFFVLTALADKRMTHNSRFGLGLEWFHSRSLKEEVAFDVDVDPGTDFNRIGLVLSHELMINEFSMITQAGYYLYDPYKVFMPVYLRLTLRRYFGDRFFSSVGVKAHAAKAEAMEFGIGYRIK